jgi:DNA-binding response OmpR family regulator
MNNQGHVMTFEQIYTNVWNNRSNESSVDAVKTIVKKIRQKIGGYIENVW